MALTNIEYGSVATSKVLNDNFNYLEDKIEDYSKNIATDKASLISLINSQIETVNAQFTTKLQTMYPVGSIYIGTTDDCPMSSLFGTWSKVSSGRVLQGASSSQTPGSTVEAGLPSITAGISSVVTASGYNVMPTSYGAIKLTDLGSANRRGDSSWSRNTKVDFDASNSSSIYGNSDTVQPPAYLVNIWRRTA